MSEQENGSVERRSLEIVRDATFTRFVADEAVVSTLGSKVEVAFIQYGSILTIQTDHGEYEKTDSRPVLTEVARMRMDYGVMVEFVMEVIRSGLKDGRLKRDAIANSIELWDAAAPSENK